MGKTFVEDERPCDLCVNVTRYGCVSWNCEYINRDEAIKAWREKHEMADRKDEPSGYKMKPFEQTEPQRNVAEDIVESFGFKAESYRQAKAKDEPKTYITEDRDTQMLDAWQVKLKAEQTEPTTQTETQNSNKNSNVISVYDGETSTKFEKVQLTDEPQTDCSWK